MLDESRRLLLCWADESWDAATEVELRLEDLPCGTRVLVRESGWERLSNGEILAKDHQAGWRLHLAHLRDYLEEQGEA